MPLDTKPSGTGFSASPSALENKTDKPDNQNVPASTPPPPPVDDFSSSGFSNSGPSVGTGKKGFPKKFIVLFVLVLVIIGAAGLVLIKGEELGILRAKPEKIMAEMATNMGSVNAVHTDGSGNFTLSNTNGQSMSIDFKVVGDQAKMNTESPEVNLNYDFMFSWEGMSFAANADMIMVDKVGYLKVNKMPPLPIVDISKLKGQWYKIDNQQLVQKSSATPEMEGKLKEIAAKYQGKMIKSVKELSDETVNGVSTYHYAVTFDKDILIQYFKDIEALGLASNNNIAATPLPADTYRSLDKVLGLFSDNSDVQIYIGKSDKLLYKATIAFNLKGEDIANSMKDLPSNSGLQAFVPSSNDVKNTTLKLTADINFSNFNQTVEIKSPDKYEDLSNALGISSGSTASLDAAKKKAQDAQRKVDLAQIRTALVVYYDDHNSYPVSNGMEKTNDKNSAIYKLEKDYMTKIPVDPLEPKFFYGYKSDGKTFTLSAQIEDPSSSVCTKINPTVCLYYVTDKY